MLLRISENILLVLLVTIDELPDGYFDTSVSVACGVT